MGFIFLVMIPCVICAESATCIAWVENHNLTGFAVFLAPLYDIILDKALRLMLTQIGYSIIYVQGYQATRLPPGYKATTRLQSYHQATRLPPGYKATTRLI